MLIKLLEDLPIDKKHKCFQGNIYEVTGNDPFTKGRGGRRVRYYFFSKETGAECAAYPEEFKKIVT